MTTISALRRLQEMARTELDTLKRSLEAIGQDEEKPDLGDDYEGDDDTEADEEEGPEKC